MKAAFLVSLLLLLGCGTPETDKNGSDYPDKHAAGTNTSAEVKQARLKELALNLKGVRLESLPGIIPDFRYPDSGCVLFLFSGYNCDTCIELGFNIMTHLTEGGMSSDAIFVVGSDTDVGSIQLRYNYREMIYPDNENLIRQELKFIYTPIILLFDGQGRITDVLFPSTELDKVEAQKFQEHVLTQCVK